MSINRVFLIVLDSLGIGELPDADTYYDCGSNTLAAISKSASFKCPTLEKMGLFNIEGNDPSHSVKHPSAAYGRMAERSSGKDTTIGHFEICGMIYEKPFPTYPEGFPKDIIERFEKETGRKTLCNRPYSGTEVIKEFGREHIKSGDLIVYTSKDSVFQIAAHEEIVPRQQLYEYCKIARKILRGEHAVGRVIARPFVGEYPDYVRTDGRHDYSVEPEDDMLLTALSENGQDVIAVGKINDIFCGKGITEAYTVIGNRNDMNAALDYQNKDFKGLCFVNLVDFDSEYGHRNDIDGYAKCLSEFDEWLSESFIPGMREDDCLIICADHGCDPSTESTDHSREYIPVLVYGKKIKPAAIGTGRSFSDIGATVAELLGVPYSAHGESFAHLIV